MTHLCMLGGGGADGEEGGRLEGVQGGRHGGHDATNTTKGEMFRGFSVQ